MKKMINFNGTSKDEYNSSPVFYCKSCLSLSIINESDGLGSYCKECGAASVGRTDINIWQEAYRRKYEKDFLTGYDIPYEECECSEHTD